MGILFRSPVLGCLGTSLLDDDDILLNEYCMATSITLARTYQYFFDTHPNRTLALTGGTLNAFGDIVAQFTQNVVRTHLCPFIHLSLNHIFLPSVLKITSIGQVGMPHAPFASSALVSA